MKKIGQVGASDSEQASSIKAHGERQELVGDLKRECFAGVVMLRSNMYIAKRADSVYYFGFYPLFIVSPS